MFKRDRLNNRRVYCSSIYFHDLFLLNHKQLQLMHDIDAQISKISGQANYMEHLQKITGNIMNVDMAMYHEKHTKLVNCDSNIKKVLAKILKEDEKILPVQQRYEQLSVTLDLANKTFYMHVKKLSKSKKPHPPQERITPGYQPSELIKTDWFHEVKHMEKAVQKFLIEVFPQPEAPIPDPANPEQQPPPQPPKVDYEKKTYEDLKPIFDAHPELIDIKTIYDVRIVSKPLFELFKLLKRFTKIIINILMMPMYDVKATIQSHWNQIEKIFKSRAFQEANHIASPEDIVLILTQFIIAKYRATVTGNNKHYVRLFFEAVGNDSFADMDGARFLEIMDAIDLDKLDKTDTVYKFAMSAKTAMRKIANNEAITPDLLQEFDSIFGAKSDEKPDAETVAAQEAVNQVTEGADIFASDEENSSDSDDEPTTHDADLTINAEQQANDQPINEQPADQPIDERPINADQQANDQSAEQRPAAAER